jgi:NADH-quinone oxidoreductase subunit A
MWSGGRRRGLHDEVCAPDGRALGRSVARLRVGGRSLMLSNYVPLVGLFALAAAFAVFSVTAAPFIGPRRYNRAKLEAYECGIEPVDQPLTGGRFPVKYYLTAMLFIVFDIEIIFLYPWAVANDALGVFGLVEMAVFIVTVFIAYAYVWRRGGLEWE